MALPKNKLPKPEELLLEYVQRMARHRDGRQAFCVRISDLQRINQRLEYTNVVTHSLNKLSSKYDGRVFMLSNSDILCVLKDAPSSELENALFQIRYTFTEDPLVKAEDAGEAVEFISTFNVKWDFEEFLQFAKDRVASLTGPGIAKKSQSDDLNADQRRARLTPIQTSSEAAKAVHHSVLPGAPVSHRHHILLDGKQIESLGHMVDIPRAIVRNSVYKFDQKGQSLLAFVDLSIDVRYITDEVLDPTEIRDNSQLLPRVIADVERKALSSLHREEVPVQTHPFPARYGFHASLETILSPEFLLIDRALSEHENRKVLFWIDVMERQKDKKAFDYVCRFLHEAGHSVGLRGVGLRNAARLDLGLINADFILVKWDQELMSQLSKDEAQTIRENFSAHGSDVCVVSDVPHEDDINTLAKLGITLIER